MWTAPTARSFYNIPDPVESRRRRWALGDGRWALLHLRSAVAQLSHSSAACSTAHAAGPSHGPLGPHHRHCDRPRLTPPGDCRFPFSTLSTTPLRLQLENGPGSPMLGRLRLLSVSEPSTVLSSWSPSPPPSPPPSPSPLPPVSCFSVPRTAASPMRPAAGPASSKLVSPAPKRGTSSFTPRASLH